MAVGPVAAQTPQIREKTHLEKIEQQIFGLVNAERMRRDLRLLVTEPILVEIARNHTRDMLEREFFEHVNPSGEGPTERVSRIHRTLVGEVTENIWSGIHSRDIDTTRLAEDIMEGFMNSPGHRGNILTPGLAHFGVGFYRSSGLAVMSTEFMVT